MIDKIGGGSFRQLFEIPNGVLSLFLTNHCNFLCANCCTESSPSKKGALSTADIVMRVKDAAALTELKGIHVSGGEPFLYPKHISELSNLASALDFRLAINTNGSWIKSSAMKQRLKGMSGVTDLFLSFSPWHAVFLPAALLKEAVLFAMDLGIKVELMIVASSEAEQENTITSIFAESMPEELDVTFDLVIAEGRARNIVAGTSAKAAQTGPCTLVNRPTISESGDLIMCCNTLNYDRITPGMKISSISGPELPATLNRYKESISAEIIRKFGPRALKAVLEAKGKIFDADTPGSADNCEVCHQVLRHYACLSEVDRAIESEVR